LKATERTLQQILHSADQYVIPVFQRYYVWGKANWEQLWDDLQALLEGPEEKRRHFLGSIVCVPEPHLPGVVPAYQVIDGQQRLTTLSILLCAVRDAAAHLGWDELAAEVEENYLIHRFKKGRERYKVFPRLRDRESFLGLIDHKAQPTPGQIDAAHAYFTKQLHEGGMLADEPSLRALFTILSTCLDFVSITLGGENPYKIFKSLNSTGVDLEQGDLIRNHIFMALTVTEQDAFDDERWRPLERQFEVDGQLNGRLFASFFRDVLMRRGDYVGENGIYEAFEDSHPLPGLKPQEVVTDLELRAGHYDFIRGKAQHPDKGIDRALGAIRDLNVTTAYPLVLALLDAHGRQQLSLAELVQALRAISGFVLRRYVCGVGSRAYNRWFCSACKLLKDKPLTNLVAFFKDKGWPSDPEFLPKFQRINLYSGKYDRAILEGIEWSLQAASEPVLLDGCWIEHVLPQSVTDDADGKAWKAALGPDWDKVHAEWLHTPGNLTLVGSDYNIAMEKKPFEAKKPVLAASKVYLNQHFANPELKTWDRDAIMARGMRLAQAAAKVWAGPL
jgi:uncharacterized protein with ParB-like and HNH nuclease domain